MASTPTGRPARMENVMTTTSGIRPLRQPHATAAIACSLLLVSLSLGCQARDAKPENTEPAALLDWPSVFDSCKDSAVDVFILSPTDRPDVFFAVVGAGVIINEAGYILTNSHVAMQEGRRLVGLYGGEKLPYQVVARNNALDLAVIKIVADPPTAPLSRKFKPARIGRSGALKIGDAVFAVGNPEGSEHMVAAGQVTNPTANWGYQWGDGGTWYHDMIGTNAGIRQGYSGGPLFNMQGELVGISCGLMTDEASNTGFAIPIDRVIQMMPQVLDLEGPRGFVLGMNVAALGPGAVIEVTKGSPADAAGLEVGDVVTSVNGKPVKVGLDFYLELLNAHGGDKLALEMARGGSPKKTTLTLGIVPLQDAEEVENLEPGVRFEYYETKESWASLPDFDSLTPVKTGIAATIDATPYQGRDRYALRFNGYISVPADGPYVFYLASDDGSRLWLDGKLVVDNDGLHGPVGKKGYVSLKAGHHRIEVTYFELSGGDSLYVSYDGPGVPTQWVPASVLFHAPEK